MDDTLEMLKQKTDMLFEQRSRLIALKGSIRDLLDAATEQADMEYMAAIKEYNTALKESLGK